MNETKTKTLTILQIIKNFLIIVFLAITGAAIIKLSTNQKQKTNSNTNETKINSTITIFSETSDWDWIAVEKKLLKLTSEKKQTTCFHLVDKNGNPKDGIFEIKYARPEYKEICLFTEDTIETEHKITIYPGNRGKAVLVIREKNSGLEERIFVSVE